MSGLSLHHPPLANSSMVLTERPTLLNVFVSLIAFYLHYTWECTPDRFTPEWSAPGVRGTASLETP
jgi:hypothetical protein